MTGTEETSSIYGTTTPDDGNATKTEETTSGYVETTSTESSLVIEESGGSTGTDYSVSVDSASSTGTDQASEDTSPSSTTAAPTGSDWPCGACDCPYSTDLITNKTNSAGNPDYCTCTPVVEQKVPASAPGRFCCIGLQKDPKYKWPKLCNGAKLNGGNKEHFFCADNIERGCGQCGQLETYEISVVAISCCCHRVPVLQDENW